MSSRFELRRARAASIVIAICLLAAAVPAAAQASAINLATTTPFVVLSGAGVTNTGPSVLNGDLGVSPGTSLTGFTAPAVVNGATHANDAVAAQAQSDLTSAYNVTAGQPVPPGNVLTGTDLGGRTLDPGAYRFSSSAQLTGQLTLDAHGDPTAQFVFVIGSTLTTATASSVILVNGASPCNVFWKVGSSATLGTSTAFAGNVLALTTISLNSSVTVLGRLLARNGEVTLINDVLSKPNCATGSSSTPTGTNAGGKNKGKGTSATHKGTARVTRGRSSSAVTATVTGKRIDNVKFTENGVTVGAPGSHKVRMPSTPGIHQVRVRVTFTDSTKPRTFTFRFRVPTPPLHPSPGPSQFTG